MLARWLISHIINVWQKSQGQKKGGKWGYFSDLSKIRRKIQIFFQKALKFPFVAPIQHQEARNAHIFFERSSKVPENCAVKALREEEKNI
jgi:hypothetical protein